MKSTMENIEKIVSIIGALIVSIGSLIAYWVQRKRDKEASMKTEAEADQLHADATKILVTTTTDTAKNLIDQYRLLSEESISSAKECKIRMEEIMKRLDEVVSTNLELKNMNNELRVQNEELIRRNTRLQEEVQELRDLVNCLSDQIEELGYTPKIKRKKDKQLLEEEI